MFGDPILILLAFIFVLLNGFFVATEFAIVKIRPSQVQALQVAKHPRAGLLTKLIDNVDEYLSACQLGITLSSLGLGWIGEPAFAEILEGPFKAYGFGNVALIHSVAAIIAFTLITVLHIVFGELAPKSLSIQRPEKTALLVCRPMDWFYRLAYPAIRVLNFSGNWVVRMLGFPPSTDSHAHSEEELRLILNDSHQSGVLTKGEKDLMDNVFEFADTRVREVMIPRGEIAFFDIDAPLDENIDLVRKTGYTRYPLCEGDIDHTIGMIHIKDLLLPAKPLVDSSEMMGLKRKLLFVPEMISIQGALNQMRRQKTLLAMVVDEYGVVSGLATLEDIIEELVGDIQDEFDQEHPQIYPTKDGGFLVDGMAPIEDICKYLDLEIEDEENDTITGHILSKLGRVADVGDVIPLGRYTVRVLQLVGLRIAKLLWMPRNSKRPREDRFNERITVSELRSKLVTRRDKLKEIKGELHSAPLALEAVSAGGGSSAPTDLRSFSRKSPEGNSLNGEEIQLVEDDPRLSEFEDDSGSDGSFQARFDGRVSKSDSETD